MKKSVPAASPDAYVESLDGWQRACVEQLRSVVRQAPALEEAVKWGQRESIAPATALRLVKRAIALNKTLGDPRLAAKR